MPRPKKSTPLAKANSMVASAAQITSKRTRGLQKGNAAGGEPWQDEAWQMSDTVGELEFYREWMSNALSRVTLHIEEDTPAGPIRHELGTTEAEAALAELFGGEQGQGQMLAAMAGHISIPGETWLVGLLQDSPDPEIDTWRVLSRDEVRQEGSKFVIDRGDGHAEKYEDGSKEGTEAEVYVTRIWRSHPRKYVMAHSSVRSALPILRELLGLTEQIAATIDSRLAGAGILFVPTEMTFSTPGPNDQPDDADVDPFLAALTQAMMAARTNRDDPASVVPLVVKAPAQYLEAIKHITFWSEFAAEAMNLRQEAIGRLAASLDLPADVLKGLADVNHWTGWLLDESAIKMHVEPLLNVITHGLTTRYLWPALQGNAPALDPALRKFTIVGDTSALTQRPNRAPEAKALHADMVITDAALAREAGLDETDLLKRDSDEYRTRMLAKVAAGTTTPDVVVAALQTLGIDLLPQPSTVTPTTVTQVPNPEPAPPPAIEAPAPAQGAPAQPDTPPAVEAQVTSILLASEAVVFRAVERASNKAGRRRGQRGPIATQQLDDCLRDAWGFTDRIAAMTGVDPGRLTTALDRYTRGLLTTGAEHDPVRFAAVIRDEVLADA